jgi:3-oxoacyl-[acyl-carrier-protein] synthase-3
MGAVIKSTAICLDQDTHSIVELDARAGEDCIRQSGMDKKKISLIINVGIFRDKNIMEPAMVTLIQQRMGVNLTLEDARYHTFAFDMLNGAGGMLNAAQAVSALLTNGDAQCALILGGDVHPSRSKKEHFPYNAVGAAMLVEGANNPNKGFQSIEMKTSNNDYVGSSAFFDINKSGADSIKTMNFHYEPDYAERLTAFTIETIQELLEHYRRHHSIDQSKIKLVSTHPWKGFSKKVAVSAGLNGHPVECLYEKYGNPHSSALMVAYHDAYHAGKLKKGDNILFLSASAGLNVVAGLYRM